MPDKISNTRKKYTERQKRILKRLIDADLSLSEAASVLGHTAANASVHFLRENEDYFAKAIAQSRQTERVAS